MQYLCILCGNEWKQYLDIFEIKGLLRPPPPPPTARHNWTFVYTISDFREFQIVNREQQSKPWITGVLGVGFSFLALQIAFLARTNQGASHIATE